MRLAAALIPTLMAAGAAADFLDSVRTAYQDDAGSLAELGTVRPFNDRLGALR